MNLLTKTMENKGLNYLYDMNFYNNIFKDKHQFYLFEGFTGTYYFKFYFTDFTYEYILKQYKMVGDKYHSGHGSITSLHKNICESLIKTNQTIYDDMKSKITLI